MDITSSKSAMLIGRNRIDSVAAKNPQLSGTGMLADLDFDSASRAIVDSPAGLCLLDQDLQKLVLIVVSMDEPRRSLAERDHGYELRWECPDARRDLAYGFISALSLDRELPVLHRALHIAALYTAHMPRW